ncbi:hypothetical protein DYBT9623_00202 [Dyadobacter sp. CECT 9623]|uniref:Uncharacterized protein n=1 Tax=Dyadobacter linearis TaxID=2823330 RepID=A0ABM8UJ28_9BACT|nr:hypothetical protein DYBT9623_00202 [Dyadobacter sp. CECT 9623]
MLIYSNNRPKVVRAYFLKNHVNHEILGEYPEQLLMVFSYIFSDKYK